MESFYGGKQGRSYKIVQHFDSIYDMVTAFQGGGTYTDVGYDEYVIIDTIINRNDKTSPENGLLYRRGYNYSEIFNVAQNALDDNNTLNINATITTTLTQNNKTVTNATVPKYKNYTYTIFDTVDPVTNQYEYELEITGVNEIWQNTWKSFVTHPGGGAEYIGQIVGPTGDSPAIELQDWSDFKTTEEGAEKIKGHIVVAPRPGYDVAAAGTEGYDANGFHDEIQYGYYTIRDVNNNITGAILAFDIPYTVFRFEAHGISAYPPDGLIPSDGVYTDSITGVTYRYNTSTHLWEYDNLISENSDSEGHPYYKYYDIQIPKGVHGRDVTEVGIRSTDETTEAAAAQSKQWYYKTKTYDETLTPSEELHPLDGFRNIYNITKDANGDFQVNYTDTTVSERLPLAQINKITFKGDLLLIQFKDTVGEEPATSHSGKSFYNAIIQQTYEYANEFWINVGSVAKGNHVLTNFFTVNDLRATYPNGLGDANVGGLECAGWVATVGHIDPILIETATGLSVDSSIATLVLDQYDQYVIQYAEDMESEWAGRLSIDTTQGFSLYAYDYILADADSTVGDKPQYWYEIQNMSSAAIDPKYSILLSEPNSNNNTIPASGDSLLNINGLWFIEIDE